MNQGSLNKSVLKALEILEFLDAEGASGITEISQKLSLDKSSVFRALNTLKSKHYVRQDPLTLKYSNSYKLFEMGHNVVRETGLPQMADPFMRQLLKVASGVASLGIRDHLKAVYIDKMESDATVRVSMKIGQSLPLYCTAMGKALLAYMPTSDLRQLLADVVFEKTAPNTIQNLEELIYDLSQVRQRGFSIDNEEHIAGLFCVASPVFDAKGKTIAAIGVSNIKSMLPPGQAQQDFLGWETLKAAEAFSIAIGGRPPNRPA